MLSALTHTHTHRKLNLIKRYFCAVVYAISMFEMLKHIESDAPGEYNYRIVWCADCVGDVVFPSTRQGFHER